MRSKSVIRRLETMLEAEQRRVEDLLQILVRKEAPAAAYEYMSPDSPRELFPFNAVVSDDGMSYVDPETGEVYYHD